MTDVLDPGEARRRLQELSMKPKYDFGDWHGLNVFKALKDAAVLIPLTPRGGDLNVVFTKRSEDLKNHSGEVSFPGGRLEPDDHNLVETALRESFEEISLDPDSVDVFGALMRMPTVTGYHVTAYVGEFQPDQDLEPDDIEVDVIFEAPLREIADPTIHRIEERSWGGVKFPVHYFDYDDQVVWGATGFMLHTLLRYLGYRE